MNNQRNNNKHKFNNRSNEIRVFDLKKMSVQELYNKAEAHYTMVSSSQQNKWHEIISRGGTRKDKISLMATEILNNPHTSLQQFEELTKWCFDTNQNFALDAAKALVNVFCEFVFVDKKSLKIFADLTQEQIKASKKKAEINIEELVGFFIEHNLKHTYSELIRSLEMLLKSTIPFVKKTSLNLLTSLTKFSQMRRLIISILINKFGDQDMEVVNEIYKNLKNEFYQDLQSSSILLQEAQAFLFRTNISRKSQFYVINFLNNLNMKILNEKGLSKLFQLFYHFFQKLMGEDNNEGSVSSRLFLNAIKGLNKIFTFIKGGNKDTKTLIQSKIQSVYKIIHKTTNTKAKIQLYLFLFQYHSHIHGSLTDRFFRSLYEFILHKQILHCSLAQLFFDLMLVSMKQDENINRVLAFFKRLLQLCLTAQANFIATTLIMISKVIEDKPSLKIVIHQKENCMADDTEDAKLYDPTKREPIYAGAQTTLVWQLTVFANHYHPTVRKFAAHILNGEQIPYEGENPMLQLSTTSFLDKLVLKKEKKSDAWKLKNSRNLSKIRKSKYETLVDKPLENFKEDENFIKKYLEQRANIHNNFKARQTTDIEEFADEVIEKQMERLNPRNHDQDLEFDEEDGFNQEDGEQFEEQEDLEENDVEQDGQQEEGDFEDNQFGSAEEYGDEQIPEDEEGGQDFDEEFQDDQQLDQELQDSDQKEFEDAFEEVGRDDDDRYQKRNKKGGFKSKGIQKAQPKGNKKSFKKGKTNNKRR